MRSDDKVNSSAGFAAFAAALVTVAAAVAPYVDRASGHRLADHIRAGYPSYSRGQVAHAVKVYLLLLTLAGAIEGLGWIWAAWGVFGRRMWARWAVTAICTIQIGAALTGLLVKDTSGDVGLAPLLGWIGLAPCVVGGMAVALAWRTADRSAHSTASL